MAEIECSHPQPFFLHAISSIHCEVNAVSKHLLPFYTRALQCCAILFFATIASLLSSPPAIAQSAAISGIGNTTSTPIAGIPHDYITGLNEVVNPANGALSIRLTAPVPHERGVNWPFQVWSYDSNLMYKLTPTWQTSETGSGTVVSLQNIDIETAYFASGSGRAMLWGV